MIRRNDRVSSFSAISFDGSSETLIESVRLARLSHLVYFVCISLHIIVIVAFTVNSAWASLFG